MSTAEAAVVGGVRPEFEQPAPKGATIHGTLVGQFEKVADKVSGVGMNTLMFHGDVINGPKFLAPLFHWSTSVCIPAFDFFNGVSGTLCGVAMWAGGVKADRVARETLDVHGEVEGKLTIVAGLSLVALSIAKLGYAILGVWNFFKALGPQLFAWIGNLGNINGVFTAAMFIAYAIRSLVREVEVHKFRDTFREDLLSVLQDMRITNPKLSKWGTPESLFEAAFELSGEENKEAFSARVVAKMRERMVPDKGDGTDEQVNYEHRLERATKSDIIQELKRGSPLDSKRGEGCHGVLKHMFAKWSEQRNWNRALGLVSVFATVCVIFIMVALPGPQGMIACGMLVSLFIIFALFFDGPGVISAMGAKKAGKWDGLIFVGQTLLLIGITVALVAVTAGTGGMPLIYALVVGVQLMVVQLVVLGWNAKRLAEQRKQKRCEVAGEQRIEMQPWTFAEMKEKRKTPSSHPFLDWLAMHTNDWLADIGEDFMISPEPKKVKLP